MAATGFVSRQIAFWDDEPLPLPTVAAARNYAAIKYILNAAQQQARGLAKQR